MPNRIKLRWTAPFSPQETNEEALIRFFNDQKLWDEYGKRRILDAIAARFGTTKMAVNKKLGKLRKDKRVGYVYPGDSSYGSRRLITIDKKFPDEHLPEKFLDLVIEGNTLLNERDIRQEEVYPSYDWKGWVGLVIGGDWHFEHYRTDTRAIVNCLKMIGQEPHLFYGFNGDAIDVLRLRFMELENETLDIPIRRRCEVVKYLFSLVPNTLFAVLGCHDNWVRTRAYYDIIEAVQAQIMGYYLGYGGTVNFKVGDITYRIAAHHKFGFESQNNHFHPCYNYLKKTDSTADVVCVAHRHDIVGISQVYWQRIPKVFIRSGSEQYKTEYAWKEGFPGSVSKNPLLLLNGTKKEMIAVVNFKQGLPILRALNDGSIKSEALFDTDGVRSKIGIVDKKD